MRRKNHRSVRHLGVVCASLIGLFLSACGDDEATLSRAELLDPETCKDCHPRHFDEWQSSMHAYAADDPVFLAMNRRGQRETGGELGDFCVKCHAPMALVEGATTDGLNMEELPQHLKGVTCYFCHNVEAVEGTHNNPLVLANDKTMRGGFSGALANGVHKSAYSKLHDRDSAESSAMCGSCHDIQTDAVHLERTFSEWQDSIFSEAGRSGLNCSTCHMDSTPNDVVADFPGVSTRDRHSHSFPGVDIALTDWPGKAEQLALIQNELDYTVASRVCYNPATNAMDVTLTNVGAGHMFPSGAAQDRRAWVEIVARSGGAVTMQSGVIADNESIDEVVDPLLWKMHDTGYNAADQIEHMFWKITRIESELMPPSVTLDASDPRFDHSISRPYALGVNPRPDEVDMVVRLRAIDLAVIDDLIATGDLDPLFRDQIKTFNLEKSRLRWTPELAGADLCVP